MNSLKLIFLMVTLAASALFIGGCATKTSGIIGSAVVKGPQGATQETRVEINNPGLANLIRVSNIKSAFMGDLLKASVAVVSKKDSTLHLMYKFTWYNAQGFETDSASSPWLPLIIYGKETKMLQAVAPNPSVKEFKVNIRYK